MEVYAVSENSRVESLYAEAENAFSQWEIIKDLVDEMIDLSLNYRQSGHPGGSRSKAHVVLAAMLSGAMRWDVLRPWRPFGDRFVLSAGHTVPLIYAILRKGLFRFCIKTFNTTVFAHGIYLHLLG